MAVPPQATEECAECINTGGLCEYHKVYDDYDRISEYAFSCSPNGHPTLSRPRRLSLGAILGNAFSHRYTNYIPEEPLKLVLVLLYTLFIYFKQSIKRIFFPTMS